MMAQLLKPLVLNNGVFMPRLGLGTYMVQGEQCQELVMKAVEIGYRHVDTAYSYGNEKDVGRAVQSLARNQTIRRPDLFLTTKLPSIAHRPSDVKIFLEESLENLKTPYVDLLLIHHPWSLKNKDDKNVRPLKVDGTPDFDIVDLRDTWHSMENTVKSGHVKSIGLSNFSEKLIQHILSSATIRPQSIQFECHAYYQQKKLSRFCKMHDIVCTCYSPLGAPGRPLQHIYEEHNGLVLLEDSVVIKIAKKYKRTAAQILLRFLLEQDFAIVTKTSNASRLEENQNIFNFKLAEDDVNELKSLDRGMKYFMFKHLAGHPEFPSGNEQF